MSRQISSLGSCDGERSSVQSPLSSWLTSWPPFNALLLCLNSLSNVISFASGNPRVKTSLYLKPPSSKEKITPRSQPRLL